MFAVIAAVAAGSAGGTAFAYRRAQKFSAELDAELSRYRQHLEDRPDLIRGVDRMPSGRLTGSGLARALVQLRDDPTTQAVNSFVVAKSVEYRRAIAVTRWLIRQRACVADDTSFSLATLAAVNPLLEPFAVELACVWPASATDPRSST